MDVKAASEIMEDVRARARAMIRNYRNWRRQNAPELIKSTNLLMADDVFREQVRSMYDLYRITNGEFHRLYRKSVIVHVANDHRRWQKPQTLEAGQ
jgi:hypothetical protein